MATRLSPFSPLPSSASTLERQHAGQSKKIVQLAKAGQFENMPAEQQLLERLRVAVQEERLAAKKVKTAT